MVKAGISVKNQQKYAIKIVRTDDEEMITNIKEELKHMKRLSHKNIVKVYEVYIDYVEGRVYTVMELV